MYDILVNNDFYPIYTEENKEILVTNYRKINMAREVSQIRIKKLYYGDVISAVTKPYDGIDPTSGLSAAELKAWLADANTKEAPCIHQGTWNYEKALPTKTNYTCEQNRQTYRTSVDDPGAHIMTFTLGKYDLEDMKDFTGGVVNAEGTIYHSPDTYQSIYKTVVALTEDNVYIVFPKADITAGQVSTDEAIGISVSATAIDPDIAVSVMSVFYKEVVDAVGA